MGKAAIGNGGGVVRDEWMITATGRRGEMLIDWVFVEAVVWVVDVWLLMSRKDSGVVMKF